MELDTKPKVLLAIIIQVIECPIAQSYQSFRDFFRMYQNCIVLHSTLWIFRSDSSIELLDDMCTEPHLPFC